MLNFFSPLVVLMAKNKKQPYMIIYFPLFQLVQCNTKTYTKANGDPACGILLNKYMDWPTAVGECKARGARLPVINSLKENQDIVQLLVRISLTKLYQVPIT